MNGTRPVGTKTLVLLNRIHRSHQWTRRLTRTAQATEVGTKAETGVEMEALTAVSVACLTLFDMLKGVDRSLRIEGVQVVEKTGGKSGRWR